MQPRVALMRMDRDILTNLKYNTFKMLMYSALPVLRCARVVQRWAAALRGTERPSRSLKRVLVRTVTLCGKTQFCERVIP